MPHSSTSSSDCFAVESPASDSCIPILVVASVVAVAVAVEAVALVDTRPTDPSIVGSSEAVVERMGTGSSRSMGYRVSVAVRSSPLRSADLAPAE